ncbi:MAG: hypothetical protein GY856_11760 [bacterium]|nr:hypothetical protein [bacterium]
MSPFVRSGDVIVLSPRPAAAIRLGDVVAFLRGEKRLVVHRVVSRRGDGFLTRGDASPRADGRVAGGEILGAVERVTRKGVRVRLGLGAERSGSRSPGCRTAACWLRCSGRCAGWCRGRSTRELMPCIHFGRSPYHKYAIHSDISACHIPKQQSMGCKPCGSAGFQPALHRPLCLRRRALPAPTEIYTHVLNLGAGAVWSPADRL